MFYQVKLPYDCYGIEVGTDGIIEEVPPIAKWMKGKFILDIQDWIREKGGTLKQVEKESCPPA